MKLGYFQDTSQNKYILPQLHGKIHPLHTCFLFQSKKALKPKVERLCTSLLTTVLLVRLSKAKPSMHAEITLD